MVDKCMPIAYNKAVRLRLRPPSVPIGLAIAGGGKGRPPKIPDSARGGKSGAGQNMPGTVILSDGVLPGKTYLFTLCRFWHRDFL